MRFKSSILGVLSVARLEIAATRRLARFWTIATAISLVSLGAYATACIFLVYIAPSYVPFVTATPKYLVSNIDPSMFLLLHLALLFLTFDTSQRHDRSRILEVLDAKPVSNLESLTGRLVGMSTLLWLVVGANILALHVFGLVASALGWHFAEPIQTHSLFNLLVVDIPATLICWCALVICVGSVFKQRVLVLAISALAMFVYYLIVLRSPFSLLPVLSSLSNHTLYISDIVPELTSFTTLLVRIVGVVGAVLLVLLTTLVFNRFDGSSRQFTFSLASILLVVTVALATFAIADTTHKQGQVAKWREFHDSYVWDGGIDVTKISGKVNIDPGKNLRIDLNLSFSVDPNPIQKLVFTFNPGMSIQELAINEDSVEFNFKNGLLEVLPSNPLETQSTHTMLIRADGIPNPRFAYFNSALDYQADPAIGARTVKLFGTDGSIFRREYVGLLPGVHWYPIPGPVQRNLSSGSATDDFFEVDLTVDLERQDWDLIASGAVPEFENGTHRVETQRPVSQIGLLASNFKEVSLDVDDIKFSIALHKRHARNLVLAENLDAAITGNIRYILNPLSEQGIRYPSDFLSMVEVPSRLRLVGGGWRMDVANTLPGVVLLKEHGYPTAPIRHALRAYEKMVEEYGYTDEQIRSGQVNTVWRVFQDAVGTDSPWSSFPHHFWTQATSASGPYAATLNQVALSVLAQLTYTWDFFSIYATLYIDDMVVLNPITGYFAADPFGHVDGYRSPLLRLGEKEAPLVGNRPSVWEHAEAHSLADLPSPHGSQKDIALLLFKCKEIAAGLEAVNGRAKILNWLSDVRSSYAGTTFTYDDLLELAEKHDLVVDPFLTDWITSKELPGYVYSSGSQMQIADDERGNSQFQSTVEVRNVRPIAGYVQFLYSDRTAFEHSPGVIMDAESSKRINLVTSKPLDSVSLLMGLSLNRSSDVVSFSPKSESEPLDVNPDPFVQESDWTPASAGIVVDDLDPGFDVVQKNPRMKRSNMPLYLGGLFEPRLTVELDQGLPSYELYRERSFVDTWHRVEYYQAFGVLRKTYIFAVNRSGVPRVRFATDIPSTGRWLLEYHIPYSLATSQRYDMTLSNGNESLDFSIAENSLRSGWNSIQKFELVEGSVDIDLVGSSTPATLYADAIKWTKVSEAKRVEDSR
ncbi:MAG: hypothetical protein F4X44_12350 [Gammaproteobacteria bacterium]|nr:hypothetical protein [Gammaproteobacteria bacterium]MYD81390.1 hypothetical protein [Gammaproteobacteria bacterium]